MSDPCLYQDAIMRHEREIAQTRESVDNLVKTLDSISTDVRAIADVITRSKGAIGLLMIIGGVIAGLVTCFVKLVTFIKT